MRGLAVLPNYEYLKKEMENRRKEAGWTQKELSNESDVAEAVISDMEEGLEVPKYEELKRIDEALEKKLSEERK